MGRVPQGVAPVDWTWERRLWSRGFQLVAGVDEAGRGALAGPVVAAAVLVPVGCRFSPLVRDSKRLSPRQRLAALEEIEAAALAIGIASIDAETVDRINVRQAARLAMKRAVESLCPVPQCVLVDAETLDVALWQESLVKGDAHSPAIAAASIVAKVARDREAELWDARFPRYGFAQHKGYGTPSHRNALLRWGPTPLHRRSFLREFLSARPVQQELWPRDRNSHTL